MTPEILLLAGMAGFAAGMLDSIVGGGGLIMTPALLNLFPGTPILQLIATSRTSSIAGASVSAWNYLRSVHVDRRILVAAPASAAAFSLIGVALAKRMDADALKITVLSLCVALAIYVFVRKDLGQTLRPQPDPRRMVGLAVLIGAVTGFYNGLIGPGTGTLMVFGFVSILGLDFLRASASAKVTNIASDLSSWLVLVFSGYVMWALVLPLVIGNMAGSYFGSRLAILKGSRFIRWVFLCVVMALIAKSMYDLAHG
jgi:uncharacterized membrane protein YfcA